MCINFVTHRNSVRMGFQFLVYSEKGSQKTDMIEIFENRHIKKTLKRFVNLG